MGAANGLGLQGRRVLWDEVLPWEGGQELAGAGGGKGLGCEDWKNTHGEGEFRSRVSQGKQALPLSQWRPPQRPGGPLTGVFVR